MEEMAIVIMIMIARFSYNLPILSPGHNLSLSLGHSAQHQQQRFHPRNLNVSQLKIRSQKISRFYRRYSSLVFKKFGCRSR